ncbi:glycosyltransferase family protein [Paenibacillus dendrobii]|nr:glycosyltransferase [Paenibacillus dendrobii]
MKNKHKSKRRHPVIRSLKKQAPRRNSPKRKKIPSAAPSGSIEEWLRTLTKPYVIHENLPPHAPEQTGQEYPSRQKEPELPVPPESQAALPFIAHKNLRVLLVTPFFRTNHTVGGQSIPEALRLLVKELIVIKAYEGFTDALTRLQPDLLLLLGGTEVMISTDLETIRDSGIPAAVWMDDENGVTDSQRWMAQTFDYVFTQHHAHLCIYQETLGCLNVHYLPFPADPEVFPPRKSGEYERCDILIIGDAERSREEYIRVIRDFSTDLKLLAIGKGWEPFSVKTVPCSAEDGLQKVYNRANMIIQWDPVQRRVFEAAACGVFQLAEASADLFRYMNASIDVVPFQNAAELGTRLTYYTDQVDQRRLIASQALWNTHYEYSPLHMVIELLRIIISTSS